ncbi:MAG TPA: cytochrome c [Burkholderiales bacterium]
MQRKLIAAAVVVSLGAVGGAALAQVKPEILVKQRQSAMTLIGKYFGPLGGMAQGKVPFDLKTVQRNAEYLHALSQMPWDGFDPSTKGIKDVKTRALPAIWEQPGKVKEAIDRFESEVGKLQQVSKGGDEGAIKAQIGAVGKACANCHDNFREKQ